MKKRIYKLKCNICGHVHVDNNIWKHCIIEGCNGVYMIIWEYPAGI